MRGCTGPCISFAAARGLLALILLPGLTGCGGEPTWPQAPWPAPSLVLPDIHSGEARTLTEHKGKVVYVDFWGSWCHPCRRSLPFLNDLRNDLPRADFEVLAVNLDESRHLALQFLERYRVDYPVLADPARSTLDAYGVEVVPSAYLVDRSGRVRHTYRGFRPEERDDIVRRVSVLLGEDPPPGDQLSAD
jgi:thiol-disulfide isomerase/thioredoxin